MATFTVSAENIQHLYLHEGDDSNIGGADLIGPDWDCWFQGKGFNHYISLNSFHDALAWLRDKGKQLAKPSIVAVAEFEL